MSQELLQPPSFLPASDALKISQQAPAFFKSQAPSILSLPYPLSLLSTAESQEKWEAYQNIFYACLRTGDDSSALKCLDELTERFGSDNERVQALTGLYMEATAEDAKGLEKVLRWYEGILDERLTNFPVRKRRAALLRSMGRMSDTVNALVAICDNSPIDAEAWAELADVYLTQGMLPQATHCLEEVILICPNAWNMHARLAETTVLSANATENAGDTLKLLSEAMRRFCRSIELCDDYLRGYYGLKLTTSRLLELLGKTSKPAPASSDVMGGDLAPPTLSSIQRLNELATSKLAEILRRTSAGESGWDGYDPGELIAARALLDRDTQTIQR